MPAGKALYAELSSLIGHKLTNGRNIWQDELKGGNCEPWTCSPGGFHEAWWMINNVGKNVYMRKWKVLEWEGCGLVEQGKTLADEWAGR